MTIIDKFSRAVGSAAFGSHGIKIRLYKRSLWTMNTLRASHRLRWESSVRSCPVCVPDSNSDHIAPRRGELVFLEAT